MAVSLGATISNASATSNIGVVGHTIDASTTVLVVEVLIRGGGSVNVCNWNPGNADPTVPMTLVRTDANTAAVVRSHIFRLTGMAIVVGDVELTYTGTVTNTVISVKNLIDAATTAPTSTGTFTDSAGSLSVSITGPSGSLILSGCAMRTSSSQTCTKDASQTERTNLLTQNNGLRGVTTTEAGSGASDSQAFTFGDATRMAAMTTAAFAQVGAAASVAAMQRQYRNRRVQ